MSTQVLQLNQAKGRVVKSEAVPAAQGEGLRALPAGQILPAYMFPVRGGSPYQSVRDSILTLIERNDGSVASFPYDGAADGNRLQRLAHQGANRFGWAVETTRDKTHVWVKLLRRLPGAHGRSWSNSKR